MPVAAVAIIVFTTTHSIKPFVSCCGARFDTGQNTCATLNSGKYVSTGTIAVKAALMPGRARSGVAGSGTIRNLATRHCSIVRPSPMMLMTMPTSARSVVISFQYQIWWCAGCGVPPFNVSANQSTAAPIAAVER